VIWLSAALVFGTVGLILLNLGAQDGELHLGFEQLIHARVPWLLLGALWAGCGLGIVAVATRRAWYRIAVLGLEVALTGLISWYMLAFSYLPPHELAIASGDAFPAYELVDQDGELHRASPAVPREPALYVFYRGDW
jgi:hypothetical protein